MNSVHSGATRGASAKYFQMLVSPTSPHFLFALHLVNARPLSHDNFHFRKQTDHKELDEQWKGEFGFAVFQSLQGFRVK